MINFVSTFPPLVCGIGSYTNYLSRHLTNDCWRVTSFRLDEFSNTIQADCYDRRVSYLLALEACNVESLGKCEAVWFQHAFGMWGKQIDTFVDLVAKVKASGSKTIASFHTIHFESSETESGMNLKEEQLMGAVLPFLDAATVFSDGAFRAVSRAFPQFQEKIVVLRHGVHKHQLTSRTEARERLLDYLINTAAIPVTQKEHFSEIAQEFLSLDTVIIGNFGFVSLDKDPLSLYELGELVRKRCPGRRVITLYAGKIQDRKDKKTFETTDLLQRLRSIHDGTHNLFVEDYLPEDLLPFAFRSLDSCVFWCKNATQSGRIAHAQGAGTCVVGRRIEGIGETLDLAGTPSGISLEDLADKIATVVVDQKAKVESERLSMEYAGRYSFDNQAKKHLLLEAAVQNNHELPLLDRVEPDVTFILPRLAVASRSGLERFQDDSFAFLNVADEGDLYPLPANYHRISLQDGTPIPSEKMKDAVEWIRTNIARYKVVVFCRYGRGRSASVAIGYLCTAGQMEYRDALGLVRSKRQGAMPLPGLAQTIEMSHKPES